MSFQDFGKSSGANKPKRPTPTTTTKLNPVAESNNLFTSPSSDSVSIGSAGGRSAGSGSGGESQLYAQVSDGILQYQRNVGILKNIAKGVGTTADGPVLETQYQVQVDVIRQLGQRIEDQLRSLENNLRSVSSRTDAARIRATHVKLNRDFRGVEATFKRIVLEVKQRRHMIESKKRNVVEQRAEEERREESLQQVKAQLMQEEEAVNLQIMREREEEIRNINQGMHKVNEIYKDLAHIVGEQQEDIDKVEAHMEQSNVNAQAGLEQVEKANAASGQCSIS